MPDPAALAGDPSERESILQWRHDQPHRYLGSHPLDGGAVIRVVHPEATSVEILDGEGSVTGAERLDDRGLWAAWCPGREPGLAYRIRLGFRDGSVWERHDPYRFTPVLDESELYLFSNGRHRGLWRSLGARWIRHQGVDGWAFAVWAPHARRVSVVGDFVLWDGRLLPMRRLGSSGVFELFVPGPESGDLYKFEIQRPDGELLPKADPMAVWAEEPPGTASRLFRSTYSWGDDAWMERRRTREVRREPLATYEVHLGSWRRSIPERTARLPTYRQIAPHLIDHVRGLGFDSIQLLPIAEHPYHGSWGYQITGYYAPTARHGTPDDFRALVDACHDAGLSVIVDWVPAHFVTDDHGLGRFDGTALYEHEDPRKGLHPDWGTYLFNLGRWEVRGFLIANALYWLEEMHVDGLRVDAVASMLYLDYSREEGEWIPNEVGGKENLESIAFLREVNATIHSTQPGCFTVAEESTAWPGVTKPTKKGGLGFDLKWNMGWMHDTLTYFGADPLFRAGCHDRFTFAMLYEHSEAYVNPLSHDEVVHGKGSLWRRMPGDESQKLANLRALFAYQMTRPGKKLLFMGSEMAPETEWADDHELDWSLLEQPARRGLRDWLAALGHLYREHSCLWRTDPDPETFRWIVCDDRDRQIFAYERRDGDAAILVVLNLTPVARDGVRIGTGRAGHHRLLLSSDEEHFGGGGASVVRDVAAEAEPVGEHPFSLPLDLPSLSALVYSIPEPAGSRRPPAPVATKKPAAHRARPPGGAD